MRFRCLIAYRGDAFHGWQLQPGYRTAEGLLTDAVEKITGARRKVTGASRTDAGVHARGQVASFDWDGARGPEELYRALNFHARPDLAVLAVESVPEWFHPRHSARGKSYRYRISTGFHQDPLEVGRALHIPARLDLDAMRAAGAELVGRHDFSAFRGTGCEAASPVRRIFDVEVGSPAAGQVEIRVTGAAFLKYMVRIVTGTLLEVGRGRRPPGWVGDVLRSGDRRLAGMTVSPHGLYLERIYYPDLPWRAGTPLPSPEGRW